MGRYNWKTENREGTATKKPNYSVKWEWRDPDLAGSYRQMTDLVYATNAERAINKVRKAITEEYSDVNRSMIVIIHVVPIDGQYYNL